MNDSTDDDSHVSAHPQHAPGTHADEHVIWSAGPGQIVNLHIYIIAAIVAAVPGVLAPRPWVALALVPLVIAGLYAWSVQAIRYELTHERLRKSWGILTRRGEDTSPTAPLLYRLNGRGNVDVLSTDRSAATLTLRAIKNHENIRNMIRERVETMRRAKGVRLVE